MNAGYGILIATLELPSEGILGVSIEFQHLPYFVVSKLRHARHCLFKRLN
jgi:hypothetical protein